MVELTQASGRAGLEGCLKAATSPDNLPSYAGFGTGIIAGNVAAKELDKLYTTDRAEPSKTVSLLIRSAGRLLTSVGACALSGSFEGKIKSGVESAAMGSAGMIAVDIVKTYTEEGTKMHDWADLSVDVQQRRYVAPRTIRAAPRPVALQARPAMESAALAPRPGNTGRPMMEVAALSTSGASLY